MAETRTYQPTGVENCLRLWALAALNGFDDGVLVMYANQGNVRLQRPFVTLQILQEQMTQYPQEIVTSQQLVDGTYQVDVISRRQGSVQLTFFGNSCWEYGYAVSRSLRRSDVLTYNRNNGIEILQPLSALLNSPEPMDTQTEPRCVQDYSYAYAVRQTEVRQLDGSGARVLERVIATGNFDGVTTIVDESWP